MTVSSHTMGGVTVVTIHRQAVRNAVDRSTADALYNAFLEFDADDSAHAAILTGHGEHFCAGADLKSIAGGTPNRLEIDGSAPMGPTRLQLSKPVIAAIEGFAVAGGLELALWCDLRVASSDAIFGVYCRRLGVPLIDGGTVRLPRLIGHGRALDLILTGREVRAKEAITIGLVNRVVSPGTALEEAMTLANQLGHFPQECLRADRRSSYEQFGQDLQSALRQELLGAMRCLSTESLAGATRFRDGAGRGGRFNITSDSEDM
jgi:enoyl-CoA hydratase